MIARIAALLVLVALVTGGAWYVLRDTPQKRIVRWRSDAESSLLDPRKLDRAEELNDKVLEYLPNSAHDLVRKARIEERKGTPESLKEALETCDRILAQGDVPALRMTMLIKARVSRRLGLLADAQAALLSVVDLFPHETHMQLGETALAGMALGEALRHFHRALEVAATREEEARAQEEIADFYSLLMLLQAGSPGAREKGPLLPEGEGTARDRCRKALLAALDFYKESEMSDFIKADDDVQRRQALRWLLSIAAISEKLALVKEEKERPCTNGIKLLEAKQKAYGIPSPPPTEVLVRLGALHLLANKHETGLTEGEPERNEQDAMRCFLQALEPQQEADGGAAKRPAEAGAEKDSRDPSKYYRTLVSVSQIYLALGDWKRLLADSSEVGLSRRISEAMASGDPDAGAIFALITGLARLRAGETAEAEKLLDQYLTGIPPAEKARICLELAEHVGKYAPESPLIFRYLDRFSESARPLEALGKRVSILIALQSRAPLGAEASRRLDEVLAAAPAQAEKPAELVGLARILYTVRGRDAAIEVLREAHRRARGEPALRPILSEILMEKARAAAAQGSKEIAVEACREALGECLSLFVKAPDSSHEVLRRLVEIIRRLEDGSQVEADLAGHLDGLFPGAAKPSIPVVASALRAFLVGQFGPALDRASSLGEADAAPYRPFLSFLKGSCHIGLATYLQRDSLRATSDVARESLSTQYEEHLRKALEELSREPDFQGCRLAILNLELQRLPRAGDIPDDLLKRIKSMSSEEGIEHNGHYLYARALTRRFRARYMDPQVKNSEIARILRDQQTALRSAIRKNPSFTAAYLDLAETFLAAGLLDQQALKMGGAPRRIATIDHDKAINVLKALPNPDEQVSLRLAKYMRDSEKRADATPYLEKIAGTKPSADIFSELINNYILSRDKAASIFLDENPPADPDPSIEKGRFASLLALRKSFDQIPESEGVRLTFRGMILAREEAAAVSKSEKKRLRDQMVSEFTKALEAYDGKRLPAPALLLNNLAWYLLEDGNPANAARALELAERGKALVPVLEAMPDMYDTHAWALYKNSRLIEADEELKKLIEAVEAKSGSTSTFRFHRASVLFGLLKYDEALAEVRAALEAPGELREKDEARRLEAAIRQERRKAIGE